MSLAIFFHFGEATGTRAKAEKAALFAQPTFGYFAVRNNVFRRIFNDKNAIILWIFVVKSFIFSPNPL